MRRLLPLALVVLISGGCTLRRAGPPPSPHCRSGSPLVGVGWGVPYGMQGETLQGGVFKYDFHEGIHNQYLGLWLRTGLLGRGWDEIPVAAAWGVLIFMCLFSLVILNARLRARETVRG